MHVFEFQVLDRAGFARQVQDGVLGLGVQDQAGGVGLRVAADDQDLLAQLGQRRQRVLGGGGLADAAFAVESDLAKLLGHQFSLLGRLK